MADNLKRDIQKIAAKYGSRVYEYQGTDGATYWSFTKSTRVISSPLRLVLSNRLGEHIINFLVRLRELSQEVQKEPPTEQEDKRDKDGVKVV